MWLNLSHFHSCHTWLHVSNVVTIVTCPDVRDVQMSVMSKCPWCPNVHDVQMSMMSKCPWCPIVHDVVTLVTCDDTNDMWSHLSRAFTIVTCGHMWANLSQWSHVVTQCQNFHMCPKLTKKSALIDLTAAPKVKKLSWRYFYVAS